MKVQELFEAEPIDQQLIDAFFQYNKQSNKKNNFVTKHGVIYGKPNINMWICQETVINGSFTIPIAEVDCICVVTSKLTSFKNFPEAIFTKATLNPFAIRFYEPEDGAAAHQIATLEGIPARTNQWLQLQNCPHLNYKDVHKHIQEAGMIGIHPKYVGPMLGFVKIKGLSRVHCFADEGRTQEAADIITKYLKKGGNSVLDLQEELIKNGFKEYAKL